MENWQYKGPLDAVARLPALRRVVALLVAVFGGLFWLVVGLDDQQDVAGWGLLASVFLVSLGVSVASAWGPIAAWQKVRAQWPDAEVVEAEIRVLNWDPFKQRKWTWMSPWNGVHHRAAWLLLEDRLVWMGLQGLPWPDSRQALPLHPVELVPNGTIPITGLPHAVVEPVFDRDTKGPVAGRFKLADPSNRSAMTLVIRSNGSAFSERFPAT